MSKLSSKPGISSSPNRAEKFQPPPPPVTRLLRSNVANRSRGRSLSSPMFSSVIRKKKADIETQEPSSPKVTCMGQVRVKRSSKKAAATPKPKPTKRALRGCNCLQRVLFCTRFASKPKPPQSTPVWYRWFAGYHHRKVPQVLEESSRKDSIPIEEDKEATAAEAKEEAEPRVFVPSSPPKNALLLMRCRSEPHRSGNRLAVSLSPSSAGKKEAEREEKDEEEEEEEEKVAQLGVSSRPLILTRCKSEPASRTGNKIVPPEEVSFSFGKKRRLGFVDRCQPHVYCD